jgi:hypothetical protein
MFDKFITITFYHNFLNIINLRFNLEESHLTSSFSMLLQIGLVILIHIKVLILFKSRI